MFMFDVETLGKRSNSAILSLACVYFNPDDKPSYRQLYDSAFFAKFDVQDQVKRLGRGISRSTLEWWAKQCTNVRNKSFKPLPSDEKFEEGYERMRKWVATKKDNKCWVWARGNLDQLVMDDIEEQVGLTPIFQYSRWRDVRTALDFLYSTTNGYVDVKVPSGVDTFDPGIHVTKHNPIDDCCYDIMQLLYGIPSQ